MQEKAIQELFHRYMNGTASPEEEQLLKASLRERNDEHRLELLEAEWEGLTQPDERYAQYDVEASWRKITAQQPARVFTMRRWAWAAAAALLVATGGTYLLTREQPVQQVVVTAPMPDVAPGTNKAVLVLADGSTVRLDSAGNQVLQQGATTVKQQGGQLVYDENGSAASVTYNTLQTPRGGLFRVTLQDGTNVWLNAASALRYPTAFVGKERVVEITGEAYFEVARDVRRPFKVQMGKEAAIEVLGTSFNVNNYASETASRTTLLSGAIRVTAGGQAVTLKPGQQASLAPDIKIAQDADLGKVVAWKNGVFDFDDVSLQDAMRQIERWYDIDVVYEHGIPGIVFGGKLPRNISLKELLAALEESGVQFRIDGEKLIVTNKQ
ncbi:FecR domain-containing protein [Chitinophaga horti]|uniref:FecR domain-containing protein n=1 Tax=Chitinophaga horti TaxID=2920382 RepID=A0ABY6J397_9BACT|nr:FecR family protein [Chitinophaga horti]UYQ94145.1 FecR domain-containing protein [Chitinophaga horti]